MKDGTVEGRRRSGELEVRVGSFYAWLGEEVSVKPAWGFDYDPAPDDEAGLVEQLRMTRAKIMETFCRRTFELPGAEGMREWPPYRTMAEGLKHRLREDLTTTWGEVLALNAALSKVAEEFDGEDVLRPETRGDMDKAEQTLKEAHFFFQKVAGDFELPALDEDEVLQNLEFIRYFAERPA